MSGLVASTRAELLRLRRWPTLWVLVGVWVFLNLSFGYVFDYVAYRSGDTSGGVTDGVPAAELLADVLPDAMPSAMVQGMPLFGGALVMILGALSIGSGYGWGTWKTALTQGPGRATSLGGTLIALASIVIGLVAVTTVIDIGVSNVFAGVESKPLGLPTVADLGPAVGAALLVLGMWTLFGALVGALAKGPALAVGLGLVWSLVVEVLLRGVAGLIDGLDVLTDHLPGAAAGSLVGALGVRSQGETDGTPGVLSLLSGGAATGWLIAYAVAFVVATLVLIRRRDLV